MKRMSWALLLLMLFSAGFGQNNDDSDEDSSGMGTTIILPDINLTITDESAIPLQDRQVNLLDDDIEQIGHVDLEELEGTELDSDIIGDLDTDIGTGNYSLSTFKLYYGRYENLLIDMNLGKSLGQLNYLITYRRNKHKDIGFNTNKYFNTEMNLDDLHIDFLFAAGDKVNLNSSIGYYEKKLALYTNSQNNQENMLHIPINFEINYNISLSSLFKTEISYDSLMLDHITDISYNRMPMGEAKADITYQADWSKDNFLKINAKYFFRHFDEDQFHEVDLSVVDKLPIIKSLALELGAGITYFPERDKSIFWYPHLFLVYKYSNIFSAKIGMKGEQKGFGFKDYLEDSQIGYSNRCVSQNWKYQAMINFSPIRIATLELVAAYEDYSSYVNYLYDSGSELYYPEELSNVNIVDIKASLEMLIAESLSFLLSYEYRYTETENLLFFPAHQAGISLDYQNTGIGLELTTGLSYEDSQLILNGLEIEDRILWNFKIAKTITDEIYLEFNVENILNQESFERIDVPTGGISFQGGIKLLL